MPLQRDPLIESSLCIPQEALELLDAGLKQLRQFKGHFYLTSDDADKLDSTTPYWFSIPNDYNTKDAVINVDATVKQFQSTAQRYKIAIAALSGMKTSLKRRLARMTHAMGPVVLARGISMVPDEILARILECVYQPWLDSKDNTRLRSQPEQLRLVCKRFQQVVDSQPSLRRRFTSTMPVNNLKQRLDKCGRVGLQVKTPDQYSNLKDVQSITSAFADALIPHAHRWEEFHFFHLKYPRTMEQVFDRFRSLDLPRLERLVLDSQQWDDTDKLYSTWTMPNLRRIVSHDGIPLELPGKAGLLECDIVLEGYCIHPFMRKISGFLGSLTSLTTLRLTYSKATFLLPFYIASPIRLPNLRELDVRMCFGVMVLDSGDIVEESGEAILKLVERLEAPQLEELLMTIYHVETSKAMTCYLLDDLLRIHGKAGSLQTFTYIQEGQIADDSIESVVENPCNGNIVISGLDLCRCYYKHPDLSSHQGGTYGLRTLTFRKCKISTDAMEVLLKLYTTREWYPNFEGIILERCDDVTWEDLAGIAHSEHVLIRDEWL